ncbi:MAG: acyl-CoA dehydrogenase family protein, partial [Solirubrobacterales bacterium]
MAINLEVPKKFRPLVEQAHTVAQEVLRPISRKYDKAEHAYPKELDMLAALIDGMNDSGGGGGASAGGGSAGGGSADKPEAKDGDGDPSSSQGEPEANGAAADQSTKNGGNLATVLSIAEMCWGDVGLLLTMPRQGLGNSAIAEVADDEQKRRFAGKWAAMASTEPEAGSDSAAIRTTAKLEGDEYVLNGEKIYVTSGDRAELIVVWASLDPERGRAAIKSFVVERDNPGLKLDRLEHKLGIRASDTANFFLQDCRVPKENLLGSPEIDAKKGFAGVMQTFD